MRAAKERYRVLFEVDAKDRRVIVHWVGARRPGREDDVYQVALRLMSAVLKKS